MNRWYVVLGGLLVAGGAVALVFQAWVLGALLLLVGAASVAGEMRERRHPGYVPMSGRSSGIDGNETLKAEVRTAQQVRNGQASGGGSYGG